MSNLHPKQIPTRLKYIEEELHIRESDFASFILKCLISEPDSAEQKNYMIAAASILERFSCLVYKGNDGQYRKLALTTYYKSFFKHWAETPEEVFERVKQYGVTRDKAELIYKLLWQIADIVCPMMAGIEEQGFVSEYVYAIEYVINHGGYLQKPEMGILFPQNYPDYNWPGSGIAAEVNKYEMFQS